MKRKNLYRLLPALGLVLWACSNQVQAPPESSGLLRLRIGAEEGRTLVPALTLARYDLDFSAPGQASLSRSIDAGGTLAVELAPVTWTITARGFAQAQDATPIAGGSVTVAVPSGSTTTITIPLGPLETGVGSLTYTVNLPAGLVSAALTLSPLHDEANPVTTKDLLGAGANGSITGLAVGYYRLKLTLYRDATPLSGLGAFRSEVVHIYDDVATAYTLSAEDAEALAWAAIQLPHLHFDHGRRITDADAPQNQTAWEEQNTYYVPPGQEVVLAPVTANLPAEAVYEWTVANTPVHTGVALTRSFSAPSSLVKVSAKVDAVTHASTSVLVKTAAYTPRTGGAKAQAGTCIEFSPAPGQFVGTGNGYSNPAIDSLASKNEEDVRRIVQEYMDGSRTWNNESVDGHVLSLGGWGGYYILGFDHAASNRSGADIRIPSNNHVAGMKEPGVVWVSQDINGDGKPNELWYQLKGSQASATKGYAMVYFKPGNAASAIRIDTTGGADTFGYYSNGNNGYPYHITGSAGTYVMFTGVLLANTSLDGYVDASATTDFDLDDAVDAAGNAVSLEYIDFVKVQTGLNIIDVGLGEYSTEAGIPVDLHFGG